MANKANKSINTPKYLSLQIKQKEIGSDMIIKFNGAGFWNVDSDEDMILPEAFDKSIEMRGPNSSANAKIAFCYQHDLRQPMGRITSLVKDNDNLKAEAVFDSIPLVKDVVIPQVNSGTLNNTSIGYRYTRDGCDWMSSKEILETYGDRMPIKKKMDLIEKYGSDGEDRRIYVCRELKLHEISIVTIGANDDTEIFGGKTIEEATEVFNTTVEELKGLLVGLTADDQYTALQGLEKLKSINDHFSAKQSKKSEGEKSKESEKLKGFVIDLNEGNNNHKKEFKLKL